MAQDRHFLLGVVVLASMGFAVFLELRAGPTPALHVHYLSVGLFVLAVACALPMRFERFVNGARRLVPLLDRRSSQKLVRPVDDRREEP